MATKWNLDKAVTIIKKYEGCELEKYKCPAGRWTIGWGHLILDDEHLEKITQEEADALLMLDVQRIAKAIKPYIKYPYMNENEFCALVSFAFNLGPQSLLTSTLLKLYNKGEVARAADEFLKWVFAAGKRLRGLERRRRTERALFLAP